VYFISVHVKNAELKGSQWDAATHCSVFHIQVKIPEDITLDYPCIIKMTLLHGHL
jgi:hypothetical protein